MKRAARALVAMACLALIVCGGLGLYKLINERGAARDSYAALSIYVQPATTSAPSTESVEPEPARNWPEVDFAALSALNPDVVGWLMCEDTVLNYPVVQGTDNDHYLDHLFDGTPSAVGCLFLDSRVEGDFSSRRSIIYGHHMKDGSMFAVLDGYKEQTFYEEHPTLLLLTPEGAFEAAVFSAYVALTSSEAWRLDFASDAEYASWLATVSESSAIDTGLDPTPADRVLTLSTCSYEYSNARLVVHAVLRPLEEVAETLGSDTA